MRLLTIFRTSLAISLIVYAVVLGVGFIEAIPAEAGWLVGMVAGGALIVSAAGCVAAQLFQFLSNKRQKLNG